MRGGGWRILRKNIDEFYWVYVFASELSERVELASVTVRRLLAERGIFPVSGPGVDSGKKILYRRAPEIEQFVLEYTGRSQEDFQLTSPENVGKSKKVGKRKKDDPNPD